MLPREHYLRQTFLDGVNFPDGFEKGGLSDIQARLIKKNGVLINALISDEVSDPTPEDLHILKVIANQSVPRSPVEQAWVKYISIVQVSGNTESSKSKAKSTKAVPATQASIQQAILAATANRLNVSSPTSTSGKKSTQPTKSKKQAPAEPPTLTIPENTSDKTTVKTAKKTSTATEPKETKKPETTKKASVSLAATSERKKEAAPTEVKTSAKEAATKKTLKKPDAVKKTPEKKPTKVAPSKLNKTAAKTAPATAPKTAIKSSVKKTAATATSKKVAAKK